MRLLHFEKVFSSPFTRTEVLRRVQWATAPPIKSTNWPNLNIKQLYHGRVEAADGKFEIKRITLTNHLSIPAVRGEVEVAGGVEDIGQPECGALVRLTIGWDESAKVLNGLWLFIIGYACIASFVVQHYLEGFAALGIAGLVLVPFWLEVRRAQAFFKNLLQLS